MLLYIFFGLDLSIISVTDGHAVRSDYLPLVALRSPTLNYVIVKFPHFYLFLLYGASVPLLPASSVGTEAWVTVADWRQRQGLWDHLFTDGEAGVWFRRAEL